MTVTTPPAPPLPTELDQLLRRLRMPYVRQAAPDVLATATSQRWEPAEVLRVLLAEEPAGRDRATIAMRRRQSGLPAGKTFDAWDENASPIPKPTQRALRTLEWIDRAEALCVCGPSGTGKSHLVEALGHLARSEQVLGRSGAVRTLRFLVASHELKVSNVYGLACRVRACRATFRSSSRSRARDELAARSAAAIRGCHLVARSDRSGLPCR